MQWWRILVGWSYHRKDSLDKKLMGFPHWISVHCRKNANTHLWYLARLATHHHHLPKVVSCRRFVVNVRVSNQKLVIFTVLCIYWLILCRWTKRKKSYKLVLTTDLISGFIPKKKIRKPLILRRGEPHMVVSFPGYNTRSCTHNVDMNIQWYREISKIFSQLSERLFHSFNI